MPYLCLALAVASSTAFADVRDHRNDPPQPEARDHRNDGSVEVVTYHRPGPRYMLPLKIDLGFAGANTSHGYAPGIGGAIGIHWASLSPTPTDTDVGIGVFGALLSTPIDPAMNTSSGVAYGGAYLEVGHTLARNEFARVWAAGRGEYLASSAFDKDKKGFGLMARLSGELYAGGVGVAPRGVFLGSYAIGLYVEAGARDMVADVGKFSVGAGLTFRTPFAFLW
ncbi:MAG TPA: hypothetical protein VFQ65_05120 [Kofleriaceae bacterium]|nr:hypothetical protein [Kofleriaceae bacterium]